MDRRARLHAARLYLVTPAITPERLVAALDGGVDLVQLRIKDPRDDDALLREACMVRAACERAGVLFVLNDRPDLAVAAGADGVHVGQDDMPVAEVRRLVGPDLLIGLSTHTPEQVDEAHRLPGDVDYIGVGPVHTTPTKPGRPAVGLALVAHAAAHATLPFFAIGGVDATNAGAIREAGGSRIAVVRAITHAEDPGVAARALRTTMTAGEGARVGIA